MLLRRKVLAKTMFPAMFDDLPTTDDLLMAWRDATRGAELARRLAEAAEVLAETAQGDAAAAEEVATLAETTAKAAEAAAAKARAAADRMQIVAETARNKGHRDAAAAALASSEEEARARDRYHDAARQARIGRDAAPTQLNDLSAIGDS